VIYLSDRMRVRDLNEAGQQDKRNAENPEPTGPGPLKTLFVHENTHVGLTIKQNYPNRKTTIDRNVVGNPAFWDSKRQIMRGFCRFPQMFLSGMIFDALRRNSGLSLFDHSQHIAGGNGTSGLDAKLDDFARFR